MLIGALNPDYIKVVSICDIRPYNVHRAFHGDWASDAAAAARPGLIAKYGYADEKAAKDAHQGRERLQEGARRPERRGGDHRPAAVPARPGRGRCPQGRQARADREADGPQRRPVQGDGPRWPTKRTRSSTVGHQRHYSVLYDNAVNLIRWGLLGEMHHIRAQWHRGNLPGNDSWQQPLPFAVDVDEDGVSRRRSATSSPSKLKDLQDELASGKGPAQEAAAREESRPVGRLGARTTTSKAEKYGYETSTWATAASAPPWKSCAAGGSLQRTGGGLMAELGSHQLDASSIFCQLPCGRTARRPTRCRSTRSAAGTPSRSTATPRTTSIARSSSPAPATSRATRPATTTRR